MFKKRLITIAALSFATALLLGSSLIIPNKPEKVSAINETHNHGGYTVWGDDDEEKTCLPETAGDYYLTDNITLSATWTVPEGTTNLCLNGFVIKLADGSTKNVIQVLQNSTLNLHDCGTTEHNGYIDSTGLWHYDSTGEHELLEGETAKVITGGIITGGNYSSSPGNGGGVQINKGEFNLYGGNIVGNYATNGAGIYVGGLAATPGIFNMSGGTIGYNKSQNCGGGVAIESNNKGIFTITGGEITGNNVTQRIYGGGVFAQSDITLGGTAKITGNTANGATNNLYLLGKTITLGTGNDAPTTMSVGVTTNTAPTETAPVKITADGAADYSANFFSDNQNYCINYNTENEYLELAEISALDVWANTYLHLDQTESNGYCKDATHQWYKIAKTNLITLGNEIITKLQTSTDAKVTSYRARYEAWARANGDYEHCYEDDFTYLNSNIAKTVTINNTVTLIALISVASIIAIGGYFFLRKKKQTF